MPLLSQPFGGYRLLLHFKHDVALFQNLAAEKTYDNLDLTLKEANEHRNEWFEGVYKCQKTDSLYDVMEKIVKAEVSLGLEFF